MMENGDYYKMLGYILRIKEFEEDSHNTGM